MVGELLEFMGRFHIVNPGCSIHGGRGYGISMHGIELSRHQLCSVSIEGAQALTTAGGPNLGGSIKGSSYYLVAEKYLRTSEDQIPSFNRRILLDFNY